MRGSFERALIQAGGVELKDLLSIFTTPKNIIMSSSLQRSLEAIKGLAPSPVWNYFVRLSQCPRPSKKEEKAIEFLREYAKENNFTINVDSVGNCLIKVPATPGFENVPTVAIQGHIDMVCEVGLFN